MRRLFIVVVALAAAVNVLCTRTEAAEIATGGRPISHYLMFSGVDLWRNGGFAHGGIVWSPQGLEREGFTLKLLLGGGQYPYLSGGVDVTGTGYLGAVLPGWRFVRERIEVTVYAGLDLQHHSLSPDDPGNDLRGTHTGLRGGLDFWWEPTPDTMAALSLSVSTVGSSYWTRGAYGWRIFDACYIGPEVVALGGDSYRQFRAGVHVTALKGLGLEWTFGAGWLNDSDERSGLYGSLGVLARQ